ncbi:hypothetical protein CUJ86_06850 [Methanofollis fontis]|uniref:Uncharacterized protein n=1 Tax=Methanofollis fontis TaxID=2052832 RepID=A0A483CY44_9EURY|nr:hypothetical protein CUJ86_06850 [Methanofollis fontis]
MRTNLQPLNGKRKVFRATVGQHDVFETESGMRRKVVLTDLRDSRNRYLENHVSIIDPVSVRLLAFLEEGDLIQFTALVYEYVKGYKGEDPELRMSRPIGIDYGLWDVRDAIKLNISKERPRPPVFPSVDELKKNKRINAGVCL